MRANAVAERDLAGQRGCDIGPEGVDLEGDGGERASQEKEGGESGGGVDHELYPLFYPQQRSCSGLVS
jgi:hypothetical protein